MLDTLIFEYTEKENSGYIYKYISWVCYMLYIYEICE